MNLLQEGQDSLQVYRSHEKRLFVCMWEEIHITKNNQKFADLASFS